MLSMPWCISAAGCALIVCLRCIRCCSQHDCSLRHTSYLNLTTTERVAEGREEAGQREGPRPALLLLRRIVLRAICIMWCV